MLQLTEHVYAETGYMGANVGCVKTAEGLVTIDAPVLPSEVEDWNAKLTHIARQDVAYAIITDFHFDHGLTAGLLCKRVVAHKIAGSGLQVMMREQGTPHELVLR